MATNTKEKLNIILENIKSQLGGVDLSSKIEDVGYVIEAGDGVARVFGLKNVMMSEMVEFGTTGIYGLALNLEEDSIGVVILGSYEEIYEGMEVKLTGKVLQVPVGEELVGRVVNPIGVPLDGKGPIKAKKFCPVERIASAVISRKEVDKTLQT